MPLLGGADVLWLQVAMDNSPAMGEIKGLGQWSDDQADLVERQPASAFDERRSISPSMYSKTVNGLS